MTWSGFSDAAMSHMNNPRGERRRRTAGLGLALAGAGLLACPFAGWAAETADPVAMSQTLIVLKLDSEKPLSVRSSFAERPPTITIEFPKQQVTGSLPERSIVARGLIQSVHARYERSTDAQSARFLKAVQIVLSASYAYRVRSEPGRIVVEIRHPASVGSASVEVALRGGAALGGLGPRAPNERFLAMQEALARATPTPWGFQVVQLRPDARPSSSPSAVAGQAAASRTVAAATPSSIPWLIIACGLALAGALGLAFRPQLAEVMARRSAARRSSKRLPSGLVLIDQLVWRAFERQRYALVAEVELTQPLQGTLRIIIKDGIKSALFFVGHGPFFEKQTVQRFLQAMRNARVSQGILVASGSFTVPAYRFAKEHQVALIGREQLTELLSAGAKSESVARQLSEQQAGLDEAKETLRQYTHELDTLRRQRNEASWFLGEERLRSAKLQAQMEAQVEETAQQIRRYETDLQRWEQEAAALRKQWEEGQWYLGESRMRAQYLETQLTDLQELAKRVESAERERDDANWFLGEERARGEALEANLADLQRQLDGGAARERVLQAALEQLKHELSVLHTFGERRNRTRASIPQARVEVSDGEAEPVFAGEPRDLCSDGVGLESIQELPASPSVRIRISLPGQEPIESTAQRMWQRLDEEPSPRYRGGYQLVNLPGATRALIERIIKESFASASRAS